MGIEYKMLVKRACKVCKCLTFAFTKLTIFIVGYPIIRLFKGDFINMQAKISLNKQFLDPKVDTAHAFNAFQISITTD